MDDRPMTPREAYQRMVNGEAVHTGKKENAVFARHLIRSQAGKLAVDRSVSGVSFSPDDANPWTAAVDFRDGELSENSQILLQAMRSNAHRTEMREENGAAKITFYVYTLEE